MFMDPKYASEFYRCLVEIDVAGIRRIWAHVNPEIARTTSAAEALTTIHMARIEAKRIHPRLKEYSAAWLAERGYQRIDGRWISGPKMDNTIGVVGIASKSADPAFSKKITTAMRDALLNGLQKGITEPPMQREVMLAAREKVRFKAARI